jgi:multidrug efflux system membrane fusion protein
MRLRLPQLKKIAISLVGLFLAASLQPALFAATDAKSAASNLVSVEVKAGTSVGSVSVDGVVEAVRMTVLSSQVAGAVIDLPVKVGDAVRAGQVLARLDARAANQTAAAGAAQTQSARVTLDVATKDFERQKQLFQKKFISQAALDQAEAQFKAAQSQVAAQIAQAGAAQTQSEFYVLRAPYAGIVAEVPVVLGDMALPGRPVLTLFDPSALRVSVMVPQTLARRQAVESGVKVELPNLAAQERWVKPTQVTLLPTVDPATHSQQLRLDLPRGIAGLVPGMFARVWLNETGAGAGRVYAPVSSVVRRAEMSGVYVIGADGKPQLRQVRLGRERDGSVEILSGISVGERVAVDAPAAARVR